MGTGGLLVDMTPSSLRTPMMSMSWLDSRLCLQIKQTQIHGCTIGAHSDLNNHSLDGHQALLLPAITEVHQRLGLRWTPQNSTPPLWGSPQFFKKSHGAAGA
ncbi:Hypothetical predicted protein [Xyrichtys novacula]|uniref:Uncharacterized protein n=1 Tax=Xyrichtys novacula TaxID=13765 RepID=A0AAV1F9S8_XYRNO|nr:Hypothetical predicted protein [Xyrichtys novacula]